MQQSNADIRAVQARFHLHGQDTYLLDYEVAVFAMSSLTVRYSNRGNCKLPRVFHQSFYRPRPTQVFTYEEISVVYR